MAEPTLEGLPFELRIQILLNVSDLHTLRSIVLSSPSYHQAYRLVRQDALENVLQRQYDGLVEIAEAITAVRSKGLHASRPSDREKIIALLDARRRNKEIRHLGLLSSPPLPLPDQPVDVNEVLELLQLHRIATCLLHDYSHHASCPEWMDRSKWETEVLPLRFSRTEEKRYFRAFYRLQAHCNMFGAGEIPVDSMTPSPPSYWEKQFSEEEAWQVFFNPLPPWEAEEFGCLWQHFYDRNEGFYCEVANDLNQYGRLPIRELPEHLRAPPSCFVLDCDDLTLNDPDVREAIASLGPTFFHKFLQEKDYMARRNLILANGGRLVGCFPNFCPRDIEVQYPLLYPADRFNFGSDLIGFQAFIATLPNIERPNLAWQKIWLDSLWENEPLYEEMIQTGVGDKRWRWGYALWDAERLIEWDAPMR